MKLGRIVVCSPEQKSPSSPLFGCRRFIVLRDILILKLITVFPLKFIRMFILEYPIQHRIYSNISAKSLQYCTKIATTLQHFSNILQRFCNDIIANSVIYVEVIHYATNNMKVLINSKGNAVINFNTEILGTE